MEKSQLDRQEIRDLAEIPDENPNPVLRVAADGNVLYANRASLPLLGESSADGSQSVPESWRQVVAGVLEGGSTASIELEHDGRTFSLVFVPLPDAGQVTVYGQDITKLKQAKDALRESERWFRAIYEAEPECVSLLDVEGTVLEMNPAGLAMIEADSIEQSRGISVLSIVADEYRDAFTEVLRTVFRGESVAQQFEIVGLQGTRRWVDSHKVPLRNAQGEIYAALGVTRDITERKRTEEALRDSELRNRTLLEDSPVCNKIIDLDSRLQYMSAAGLRQLKISDIKPFYGSTYPPDFYPESMRTPLIEHLERAKAGETSSLECPVLDIEGGEVWYHTTFVPARDDEGRIKYIIVTSVDITERKQAEEALRRSEERLDLAVRGTSDGLWEWDIATGLEYWSPRFKELLGYGEDEVEATNANFLSFLHPEDKERVIQAVRRHLEEDEPYDIEFRMRTKSGGYRCFHSHGQAARNRQGKPVRMAGFVRDVTQRRKTEEALRHAYDELELRVAQRTAELDGANRQLRQDIVELHRAESALRESESRLRTILQTAADGIVTIDEEGTIESFNPAAERMFRYPADDAIGKKVSILMPSPYHEEYDGYLKHYLKTGERRIIGIEREVTGRRSDGTMFVMNLAVSEAFLGDRRIFTGIVHDTSKLKASEEALRHSNEELEEFAYSVSHDLKAPLRAIEGFAAALVEDYGEQFDDAARGYLRHVSSGAVQMHTLIDDLLDHARLGRGTVAFGPVEMEDVVREVQQRLSAKIEDRHAVIHVRVPLPTVNGHRSTLQALMQNLIGNAIKFVPPGRSPEIEISGTTDDICHRISVRDNGIGIEEKYFEMIFGIFQRLHTSDAYPGTGIGLAIAKKAASIHHGRIQVESTPGAGSTFHVIISREFVTGEEQA